MNKIWNKLSDLFSDKETPEEPGYDPAHIGAMVLIVIFTLAILFWTFWCLLVYKGGLPAKVSPFLKLIFTSKILTDFGYEGTWEQGSFEGWLTNLLALFFLLFLIWIVASHFRKTKHA